MKILLIGTALFVVFVAALLYLFMVWLREISEAEGP